MLGLEAAPSLLFLVLLFFVPESPRWLTKMGKDDLALDVLKRIQNEDFAEKTVAEIRASLAREKKERFATLFQPSLLPLLLIGVALAVLQQWSGINVIFFYAPDIFTNTGVGIDAALFQTVLVGVTNVVFTLVALWLVDKIGRKILLLIGASGMALCYIFIGALFRQSETNNLYLLILSLITIAFYATSLAPVVWVLISEIFPNRIRGVAMAVATF